jgi:hypothetical protein
LKPHSEVVMPLISCRGITILIESFALQIVC